MELQSLAFFGTLLLILGFCHCSDKYVEVNGLVECSECSLDNIESAEVLSGIGEVKDGKFKVALPNEIVDNNGQLREECFAQLKNISSDITCPSFDDELEASKVVTQSIENGKHILGTKGKLDLSPNVVKRVVTMGGNDQTNGGRRAAALRERERRLAGRLPASYRRGDSRRWEKTTNVGEEKQQQPPVGGDSRASGRGQRRERRRMAAAFNHYGVASSRQRSNDRRDTDHGGRRTADLTCAGREMDAEAVAGEKKTKGEVKEMDGGLKLGFCGSKNVTRVHDFHRMEIVTKTP
ncbi:hypothetical protein Scep_002478 [Stephania cephalantha]|uniref:Uncharacterized protein n=1 Tax=Stephania cephalantha TaxID=152367 RepID=A0AAP0Q4C1_9MAGN